MTAARARAYAKYYDNGELPAGDVNKDYYKMIHVDVLKCELVALKPVPDKSHLTPWARQLGHLYKPDARRQLWRVECSCGAFSHTANRCVCSLAICGALGFVKFELLIDGAAAKKTAGRPRANASSSWADRTSGAAKHKSVTAILGDLKSAMASNKVLRYHKHKVVCGDGSAESPLVVGHVRTAVRVGVPLDGQMQVWKFIITFPDDDALPDEEWTVQQLAKGLWLARETDCSGIVS
ncbi:hypothetical protein M885DRAFT_581176 [Pelagophyceae sp. CCMP2097]|nr:hypothetical protein M885DRAFT_581176 [Pelagophyceae sp. CCMP2097]